MALNDHGDIPTRLFDIGEQRIAAMDEAGVDVQILSIARREPTGSRPAKPSR
ncbi:hypothetical protein NKH77_04255 [Streptomyces sp. M19]